ncbi:MAG TPA: hypothetical protein VF723_14505 [Pyrinomonadaceae bacterium]|jgi:hypothetical protein
MKSKVALVISVFTVLLVLFSQPAVAQLSGRQQLSVANGGSTSQLPLRHIASILSRDIPGGARVTITSDTPLGDYMAYRKGNHFYVTVPQSDAPNGQLSVSGTGFSDARVENQGGDLLFTFRLDEGVSASVNQKFNRLEVAFVKAGGATPAAVSAEKTESAPALALNSTVPASRSTRSMPVAAMAAAAAAAPSINQVDVDLSVPESPAFTVLGVTPETVTRPTTPREFATSLLNGVDQQGNFQTGLALDFVPFLTFAGNSTSLFSYKHNPVERFLARTQLSFATTKGATDADKSTRLALGLRLTLWDTGDPRLDTKLEECYAKADKDPRLKQDEYLPLFDDPEDVKAEKLARRKALLGELDKPCNDASRKRNWNNSSWIVGAAPSWISKTGETKNFLWNGGGFWTSLAYGFAGVEALKDNSQLIFHARYRNNESVADPDNEGQFFSQDSAYFGTRLRIAPGSAAKSIFSLEGNFVRSRRDNNAFDNSSRYSLGLEQRMAENIWFSLALGGQSGRTDGNNKAFVLTSFKWGFTRKDTPTQ